MGPGEEGSGAVGWAREAVAKAAAARVRVAEGSVAADRAMAVVGRVRVATGTVGAAVARAAAARVEEGLVAAG